MEQIIIQISNKQKAQMLLEWLRSLDFVDSVQITEITDIDEYKADFFAMAGLWADREINLTSIRQKAWTRQPT